MMPKRENWLSLKTYSVPGSSVVFNQVVSISDAYLHLINKQ